MKSKKALIIVISIIIAVITSVIYINSSSANSLKKFDEEKPIDSMVIQVKVREAKLEEISTKYRYPVIADYSKRHKVKANIDGFVDKILVDLGQQVKSKEVVLNLRREDEAIGFKNTSLKSNIDGEVISVDAKEGDVVSKKDLMLEIADTSSLYFKLECPVSERSLLTIGRVGTLKLDASKETLPIIVTGLSSQVNRKTGTISVVTKLNQNENLSHKQKEVLSKIYAGVVAEATFTGDARQAVLISKKEVILKRGKTMAKTVKDNIYHEKEIMLGDVSYNGKREVIDGLDPKEKIVIYSKRDLIPQDKVEIIKDEQVSK